MLSDEQWIWLPKEKYPQFQKTKYSGFGGRDSFNYAVAEFKKEYSFDKKIRYAYLRFSGDTEFQLFLNGKIHATGPASVGGDFIGNDKPRENFYAAQTRVCPDSDRLEFFARVKLMPIKICEYSKGRGGFMLTADIVFEDGTEVSVHTDKSWSARYNGAYSDAYVYDGTKAPDAFCAAEEIPDIWHAVTAPIKIRSEEEIFPAGENPIQLNPREEKNAVLEFDRIYAGFIRARVKARGELQIEVACAETDKDKGRSGEKLVFDKDGEYRGLQLHSAGKFFIHIKNCSDFPASLSMSLIATFYPVFSEAKTTTSDESLNRVLDVCAHTLKFCRQTHHLDSPKHCEPLACTGDYYIESLMTAFSFGDMSLAEFDVLRTAELLRHNDGRMFHTTYSLIWVKMLYDVYMFTENIQLLEKCEDALALLLARFGTYIGENGLIENPPDYMFVDWIYIDGFSLHHPPKALGQTCLNMFYFGALDCAVKIYKELSRKGEADICAEKRENIRTAVNSLLFDKDRQLYFEGLNTKTPDRLLNKYMPQNTDKRYYLKHSNILASYFGICGGDTAKELIKKIMTDECPGEFQPYFAHYLLEAIYENGLRERYTLPLLEKWKKPVEECPKGLAEGFILPDSDYVFDHSHAWGGTPLYSLPKALLGLKIIKPGLSEIELSPSLLSLQSAKAELPTLLGPVICEMKEGEPPKITAPEQIKVHIR